MKKKKINDPEELKPDLRHDSMEYSASSDGEDPLDYDDPFYEEDGISAEELENLEEDDVSNQAAALDSVETDRLADEDNLPDEDWTNDLTDKSSI